MAGKRHGLRAELGGEAIYAWVIGEHLRDIKEASRNIHDKGMTYHAAVNEFLSFVGDDIGYYTKDWEDWQTKSLLDANGKPLQPGAKLTKAHRRREVGHAVGILRRMGILGYKRTDFSDDAKELKNRLRGGRATRADSSPPEDPGDEGEDDDPQGED